MENANTLSLQEKTLLREIADTKRYTVVRLELRSTKEDSLRSTALAHVHMQHPEESMEEVKATGALIASLESKGLVRTDYERFATLASDYAVYADSLVFRQLCQLVEEGKKRQGFLFDTPYIKRGQVFLTPAGKRAAVWE